MKKTLLIVVFLIVLLLDWPALDDITTGREPSFFGEYLMLGASVLIFPVLFLLWKKPSR